jgi:Mitochondrial carrier protein
VRVYTGAEPETLHKLGIGAFAGLIAQSCTYPLEVVRRRMQTAGMIDHHGGVNQVCDLHTTTCT